MAKRSSKQASTLQRETFPRAKVIPQISLVTGIVNLLTKWDKKLPAEPRLMNTVVEAANNIIRVLESPLRMAGPGVGLEKWLQSDDTGMSSRFMASVVWDNWQGESPTPSYPLDPSDFGRCVRMLIAVSPVCNTIETRAAVARRMKKAGGVWAAYAERWAELEALYAEEAPSGNCPKLYKLMQSIRYAGAPERSGCMPEYGGDG